MSAITNDGGNAFPHAQRLWDNDAQSWAVHSVGGMTLRDYFAGQALAGFIAASTGRDILAKLDGRMCYQMADAMLAARERKEESK